MPAAPPLLCPTLIGRDEELAALAGLLASVGQGTGRTALVGGEAGIGKSALLRRFAENARATGARVEVGECTEIEARRPLGPFMAIAETARGHGRLRSLPSQLASEDMSLDEHTTHRAYQAFAAAFIELARAAPLVIAIEDLHWADEGTLELFQYLARRLRQEPVLLVGSYRTDELHRRHPLRPVLAELTRARLVDEIGLGRLDRAAVSALLRETLRSERDPEPAFRDAIQERCEGNPFFVEEVLKALAQRNDLAYHRGRWEQTKDVLHLAIPDSVRAATDARLQALDPETRRALRVAAVLGQTFDFEVLRIITRIEEDTLVEGLRRAVESQLIVLGGDQTRFAFRHALTRESVLAELFEPERRRLHFEAALAIEAIEERTADRVRELAYHFDAAHDVRAHAYHLLAAEAAERGADFGQAALHLERALALAPANVDAAGLYLRIAEVESARALSPRGAAAAAEAARRYAIDGRSRQGGRALTLFARMEWVVGDPEEARIAANQAVGLLDPHGNTPELAAAYAEVARLRWFDQDNAGAKEMAERAIRIARKTGSTDVEADALITMGGARAIESPREGIALLREGIDLAKRGGLSSTVTRGYANLGGAFESMDEARRLWVEWDAYNETVGYRPEVAVHQAVVIAIGGADFDAVLRYSAEATGQSFWSSYVRLNEALVRISRDGPPPGVPLIEPAVRRLAAMAIPHRRLSVAIALQPILASGDWRGVLEHAEAGADLPRPRYTFLVFQISALITLVSAAHAARELGDVSALDRWSARARALADGRGVERLAATFVEALALADRGDAAGAARLLAEIAEAIPPEFGAVTSALVRLRAAELLRTVDPGNAAEVVERVVGYWRKAKATWYLGELERWATSHELPFPREREAARPAKQQLTEREREIARLVAQGLTNKSIAEELVISERTAEGHVQRIMGKLDFRSRAQIAAWIAQTSGQR